jgi:16S rRNA (guanine1207-N2)-methyltransferase
MPTIEADIRGVHLLLQTAASGFSPLGVDRGTSLLLSNVRLDPTDKVLDLGCGYGVMGIYAAKVLGAERVFMIDKDPEAVALAAGNARENGVEDVYAHVSDGFNDLRETGFTKILCNPPYHTDFAVAKHFIEKGFNRLTVGGELWMVTKREAWYRNKLTSVFGGARVVRQDSYCVFQTIKKSASYARRRPPSSAT